jgi:hypothetical protein
MRGIRPALCRKTQPEKHALCQHSGGFGLNFFVDSCSDKSVSSHILAPLLLKEYGRLCKASSFEKPGAVILHAGICEGQSGNRLFYLDIDSSFDSICAQ